MREADLFALLEHTADAAYTITEFGEICSWNSAAVELFGYPANDVLGRNIGDIIATSEGNGAAVDPIPDFDQQVRLASGRRTWVNTSVIVVRGSRLRRRLIVRLLRDIDRQRRNEMLVQQMLDSARQLLELARDSSQHAAVEALSDLELRVLRLLADGESSASIAQRLVISPLTLRNHCTTSIGSCGPIVGSKPSPTLSSGDCSSKHHVMPQRRTLAVLSATSR